MSKARMSKIYNETQQRIIDYLFKYVKHGKRFFKAKHIARDLGLTPREVGVNLGVLSKMYPKLKIERWSYSNATTWNVELRRVAV